MEAVTQHGVSANLMDQYDTRQSFHFTRPPEGERPACSESVRALLVAVLEDALRVMRAPLRERLTQNDRRQATRWFASRDRSSMFTFERVCEVLRLDPNDIRAKVRAW